MNSREQLSIDGQMALAHQILSTPEQGGDFRVGMFGYCPICRERGVQRERRPNGNDRCAQGHSYASREAINTPTGIMEPI